MADRSASPHRLVVDGRDVAALEVADTYAARARGLLGRDGLEGAILLRPSNWVHTFRMRFPIDVAHLDRDGVVLRVATVPPNRPGRPVRGARAVLESEAGRMADWAVAVGARVRMPAAGTAVQDDQGRSGNTTMREDT